MGDANCDECEEQPYLAPLTEDYEEYHDFDGEPDVEIWCECPTNVPVVFDDSDSFDRPRPDHWGQAGSRFVCYECGEIPRMGTSARMGGTHPKTMYHLSCRCEHSCVGFSLRGVMPDKWKKDMDPTKWPNLRDEIEQAIAEHGPMNRAEIAEHVDLPEAGVKCLAIHMQREHDLYTDRAGTYYVFDQIVDSGQYDIDESGLVEERDSETGIRSGKGNGLFSRLLGLGGD